jgi:hypothetical protein
MPVCKNRIHRALVLIYRGSLCSLDTENTENNNFSIIVERTIMENHSAAYAAETAKSINSLVARHIYGLLLPEGLNRFAFRRLSEKQK